MEAIRTGKQEVSIWLGQYFLCYFSRSEEWSIANWLMFMKAGEAGWKSIIPVYNTYTAYKIAWTPNMFWIYFIFTVLESIFSSISGGDFWSFSGFLGGLCGLVTIVLSVFYCVNLAKSFGKGLGFTIGLIFLEPIFVMMIAFGSARYQKY